VSATRTFRPVRPDEIEHICRIAVRAWEPIFAYYRSEVGDALFGKMWTGWQANKADQVRQAALRQPDCVYVTAEEGKILGFITFHIDRASGVGTIGNNAVDPDCQSRGVGTAQHRQVLQIMRERGMRAARVTTGLDEAHGPARRSYEKAGFNHATSSITYYLDLDEE